MSTLRYGAILLIGLCLGLICIGIGIGMWGASDAAVWPILPIGLGVGIILYAVSKLGDE